MKNTQKKFLSAVLAASSVAGVVAPAVTTFAATTTEVETFVANAKKDLNFYSWNVAYGAIVSLPADQQGKYLDQIAPLEATVKTEKIKTILAKIDEFYKTSNVSIYDEIVYTLIPQVTAQQDKDYLANELSKYGKPFYEKNQPEYPKATDAIIAVDNAAKAGKLDEAKALIPAAEAAIAKVTHAANNTYLKAALDEVITRNKINATTLGVKSVTTGSAKSFVVKFNRAVADTDKVTFDVTRLTTAVAVTATWNADKTEATLTSGSNFAEATFAVSVKADAKEIAKESVTITAQKAAKLEFTSKSVAVNASTGKGYATYKVYDQYNNDITTSYLANNINIIVPVGTPSWKDGILVITPGTTPLVTMSNLSITAYDTTSGLSTTASLPTQSSVGTLSEFKLGSVDNVKLVDGDVTSVYYIPFTAKDASGNETKNYNLISSGLINTTFTTSLANVEAKLVQDPADSRNSVVQVKVINPSATQTTDMPLTITAMTYNGTSTVSTTVSQAKVLKTLTLFAPSETVAVGEEPEIGFEAYDQAGNKITKFSEINGKIGTPVGVRLQEKVDGTAKFIMNAAGKGLTTLSVSVNGTSSISTLNINVQEKAKPSKLALNSTDIVAAMEQGAKQETIKIGDDDEIIVYDQYDRKMSDSKIKELFNGGNDYKIIATTTGALSLDAAEYIEAGKTIAVNASNSAGSGTLVVALKDKDGKEVSSVSTALAVVKTTDITDYTITDLSSTTIYAGAASTGAITAADKEYAAGITVYGKTNSGAKVFLAKKTLVTGTSVTNGKEFVPTVATGDFDDVKVTAVKPVDGTKTEATTEITVTINHNEKITALKTSVKSSTVAPVATDAKGEGFDNDVETIAADKLASLNGKYVVKFDRAGNSIATANNTSDYFYFRVKDSYGKYPMSFGQFDVTGVTGTGNYDVSDDGILSVTNATAGDSFYITAVTNNSLAKRVKVVVTAPTVVTPVNTAPKAPVVAAQEVTVGTPATLSVVFTDAEGDALTYTANTSDATKATVAVDATGKVTVTPVAAGETTITVTAKDGKLETPVAFKVTVKEAPVTEPDYIDQANSSAKFVMVSTVVSVKLVAGADVKAVTANGVALTYNTTKAVWTGTIDAKQGDVITISATGNDNKVDTETLTVTAL